MKKSLVLTMDMDLGETERAYAANAVYDVPEDH